MGAACLIAEMVFGYVVSAALVQSKHGAVGRLEQPDIPAIADFAFNHLENRPTGLVGVPQSLLATAFFQLVVDRLE